MNGVEIRAFRYQDITADYLRWMNDPEVTRFLGAAGRPQSAGTLFDYVSKCFTSLTTLLYAIEYGGRHVGNIKLVTQPEHGKGVISIMIGEKALWGRGIGTEAVRQVVELAFLGAKMRKLEAGMLAPNFGSLRLFSKCGFHVDGVHTRDRYLEGAGYVDAVYMSLFRKDWEGNEKALAC